MLHMHRSSNSRRRFGSLIFLSIARNSPRAHPLSSAINMRVSMIKLFVTYNKIDRTQMRMLNASMKVKLQTFTDRGGPTNR